MPNLSASVDFCAIFALKVAKRASFINWCIFSRTGRSLAIVTMVPDLYLCT